MTAQQIYEIASSFLYESNGEDEESKEYSLGFLNVLLQEALPYENSIRRHKEMAELSSAPYITDFGTTIEYDDSITRIALPYGLAAHFFQEAMNDDQAENYRGEYALALVRAGKATQGVIEDANGG
jgi:hypothetical protein